MQYVGGAYPVHDAYDKASGRAVYAGDMRMPGMLHMALLLSPHAHALVKSIDCAQALALPGVRAVLHCFNTTEKLFNRYRTSRDQELEEQERVFNQHVRFIGDRVAGVVAEDIHTARQALALLKVEYELLPYVLDMSEVLTGRAPDIHAGGAVYQDFAVEIGSRSEPQEGLCVTTTSSKLARINHVAMENHACVADYNPGKEELTIWSPNQSVYGVRTVVADLLQLPYSKVRVIKTTMGGSFGCKQEWMLEPVTAAAALMLGAPVRLSLQREENMLATICRCPLQARITTEITTEGRMQSIDLEAVFDAGAYLGNSYEYAKALSKKFYRNYNYAYANYTAKVVYTNTPVSGAYRGWTSPEFAIIIEHNLDMAARRLGMDPLELRLINAVKPGDMDKAMQAPLDETRLRECLLLGRRLFDWEAKRSAAKAAGGRYIRGVGMAAGGHVNGYYPRKADFTSLTMKCNEDGSVEVKLALHDHGCGTVAAFKLMVGEALGLDPAGIYIKEGDTSESPFDIGCYSSRTTYVLGRAAVDCAHKLKELLRGQAAKLLEMPPADLEVENGRIYSRQNPQTQLSFARIAELSQSRLQEEIRVDHSYINHTNPGVHGVHFAQVEIDCYTGMVKVLDYLAVHDIGKAINKGICTAQVQGAVQMGLGAALSEQMTLNARGQATNSLRNYHIINSYDMPQVEVHFIEDGGTEGPFGAKSIGELAIVPVAPAIISAINHALDSDICQIPITADVILQYLAGKGDISCC